MNMMSKDLVTPAQIEHANALLGHWLGNRMDVRLDHAVKAVEDADRKARVLRGKITPRLIETLLKLRGWRPAGVSMFTERGHKPTPIYMRHIPDRPFSQTEERIRGLAYARAWRERNQPIFDRIYGRKGGAE